MKVQLEFGKSYVLLLEKSSFTYSWELILFPIPFITLLKTTTIPQ